MPDDYEGEVIATLVDAAPAGPTGQAVLYLHGYVDYFFQDHMAERFVEAGYRFYALDLRKYGRSLLPHQHQNYSWNLNEYYPEIDRAIETIRSDGNEHIVLLGHSTGGLIASLYCAEDGQGGNRRQYIDRLVLNSPFFEFNTSRFKRDFAIPFVGVVSRILPYAYKKNELSPLYAESVHQSMRGEWDYDLALKPKEGIPLYFAWLRAVRRGQKRLKRGLHIPIPVLVLHSDRSSWEKSWNDTVTRTDAVLNVEDIKRYAPKLGQHVTVTEIPGGLHDLVLSARPVRERFFTVIFRWLAGESGD